MALLSPQLATALGRPDLAFAAQANSAYTAVSPIVGTSPGSGMSFAAPSRGPAIGLFVLVAALGGFIYWVHPHLL